MIKLRLRTHLWSNAPEQQKAYDRGQSEQAERDAEAIREWLVETGQLKGWIAPEIEIVEESEDTPQWQTRP